MFKKKTIGIIDRIEKRNALGFIYNIPKDDAKELIEKLSPRKHLHIKCTDAPDYQMLKNRLGFILKMKGFSYDMLPGLIDNKILTLSAADIIKPSYSKVFQELSTLKIPMLLIMTTDSAMNRIRKFEAFNNSFTIEQNYKEL